MDEEVHLGSPLPEGEDSIAIMRSPSGRGLLAPRSIRNLSEEGQEYAAKLQAVALVFEEARSRMRSLVVGGRDAGMSHAAIGWCLGLSESRIRQIIREETEQ